MRWPAPRGLTALQAVVAAAALLVAPPAVATPAPAPAPSTPDSEQSADRVASLRGQLETLEAELEIAAERYNAASSALDAAVGAELGARRRWDADVSAAAAARRDATRRVRALYRDGPAELTVTAAALDGRWGIEEIADTWRAAREVVDDDARTVTRARGLTDRSLATSRAMEDARRDRAAAEEAARAELDAVEAAVRAHEAVLAGAEADLAEAVERERQEAEALAVAWAVGSATPIDDAAALAVVADAAETAPSAPAAAAVAAAATRLGTPYTWGATGPGTFDCSGLVLWAYARAGIAVPRTSRQQHAGLTPVSLDSLLPGDLVFYASGPDPGSIHHVGLAIGSGLMIHAPRTGDVVRIAAVDRRPPFAAVRPAPADI